MQGYRTILFNLIMGIAAVAGWNVSPDLAQDWTNGFIALWTFGNVALRAITKTPIFGKE
jgi:hypothetical protein